MILTEAIDEVRRLSQLLENGLDSVRQYADEAEGSERDYRKAVAEAWVRSPEGTVAEREAWVNGQCADLRFERDLAENMRRAAIESVRSRQTQISVWQTLINAHREEASFGSRGPVMGP